MQIPGRGGRVQMRARAGRASRYSLMDDPVDIRAWQRLDDHTTTSGKIEEKDVARLAAIGVKHVINLALDDHPEALADEAAVLARHGLSYTHIPVPFDAPNEAHFEAFCAALEDAARRTGPCPLHHELSGLGFLLSLES